MYASVRRFRCAPDEVDAIMHRVDSEFADKLGAEPGFCSYQAIDCGDGTVISVTCFREEAEAKRSAEISAQWVGESLADFDIERTEALDGEVMVSRAMEPVLEATHH